ncbi:MAG: WD40/YVTN/BNR-like repeat-containing protein [Candidatus Dormibacteria bacterium]
MNQPSLRPGWRPALLAGLALAVVAAPALPVHPLAPDAPTPVASAGARVSPAPAVEPSVEPSNLEVPTPIALPSPGQAGDACGRAPQACQPSAVVAFSTSMLGLVALGYRDGNGSRELVLRTVDGGGNWTPVLSAFSPIFSDVRWVDPGQAMASAADGVWSGEGGAVNWRRLDSTPGGDRVLFTSRSGGYLVQRERLYRVLLVRGGAETAALDPGGGVSDVTFSGPRLGWVAGADGVFTSSDAGRTWSPQTAFPPGTYAGYDAYATMADPASGFVTYLGAPGAAGRPANFFHTSDSGEHWDLHSYSPGNPPPVAFTREEATAPAGILSRPAVTGPDSALVLDLAQGADQSRLCGTDDGALSWSCQPLGFVAGEPVSFGAVGAHGPSLVWAAVVAQPPAGGPELVIATTGDAGADWQVEYRAALPF